MTPTEEKAFRLFARKCAEDKELVAEFNRLNKASVGVKLHPMLQERQRKTWRASWNSSSTYGGAYRQRQERSLKLKHTTFRLNQARQVITREDTLCFDVAAQHGQQFENVKHLTWFLDAVATELLRQDEQEIAIYGKKAT